MLITEVLFDPAAADAEPGGEYVVLHNVTDQAMLVTGWALRDAKQNTALPPFTVPADGRALIAASEFVQRDIAAFEGAWITLDGRIGNGLNNTGDALVLIDGSGTAIDALSWGDNLSIFDPPIATGAPGTVLRRNSTVDTDTAADWTNASNEAQPPTPEPPIDREAPADQPRADNATVERTAASVPDETRKADPASVAPARIMLSEVAPDTGWLEIYNEDSAAHSLRGWMADDTTAATPPVVIDTDMIEPYGFVVIRADQLADFRGNTLRLLRPDGTVADIVTVQPLTEGKTFSRYPVQGGGWQANTPATAGSINLPAEMQLPTASPTIASYAPTPRAPGATLLTPLPNAAEPFTNTARDWLQRILIALLATLVAAIGMIWLRDRRRAQASQLQPDKTEADAPLHENVD